VRQQSRKVRSLGEILKPLSFRHEDMYF
jgi:hypothetical protein